MFVDIQTKNITRKECAITATINSAETKNLGNAIILSCTQWGYAKIAIRTNTIMYFFNMLNL